jgi:peptide-methionine (R)-S-oxide reductase
MKRGIFLGSLAATAIFGAACSRATAGTSYAVTHTDDQWRTILGPRYYVLREGGTEPPGSSPLNAETRQGIYHCAGCNLALFSSKVKYDAGEGWPSFWDVLPDAVLKQSDYSLVEERTEIHCRQCGGHLGHIFPDGPPPTHLRYCIDGLALVFVTA